MFFVFLVGLFYAIKVPKYQYIYILKNGEESICDEEDNKLIEDKNEFYKYCQYNPEIYGGLEMCKAVADAKLRNECFFLNEDEIIESIFTRIDSSVELIIVYNQIFKTEYTIDFNKLPRKMDVIYVQEGSYTNSIDIMKAMAKSSLYNGTPDSIISFLKESKSNNIKNRQTQKCILHLVGNIKEKVSTLTLNEVNLDIIDSDLNIDTLIIEYGEILSTTQNKIMTNNFIQVISYFMENEIDFSQYKTIAQPKLFQVYDSNFFESNSIEIIFSEDHFTIVEDGYNVKISYDFANYLGMITIVDEISFSVDPNVVFPDNFALNLSFQLFYPTGGPDALVVWSDEVEEMEKTHSINLIKKGEWPVGLSKPKIIINADEKIFNVNTNEIEDVANIVKNPDEIETTNSNQEETTNSNNEETTNSNQSEDQLDTSLSNVDQSTITSDPFIVPDTVFKEDEIKPVEIDDFQKANEAILNTFNNEDSVWSDEKDHVVQIIGENINIPLNLDMKDNQFISLPSGSTIVLEGGNLNVVIPNKDDILIIKADTSNNINVSIKGGGKIQIKPQDAGSSKPIHLNSNCQLNSSLSIEVNDDDVDSITIDSISIFKVNENEPISIQSTNSNGPIHLNINNFDARKESVSLLENATINKRISIEHPSSTTLNNVSLKNAVVLLKLDMNSDKNEPLIHGNLIEIPNTFSIEKVEGKPKENYDYVLIKASFNCEDWKSKLNLDGSDFDQKNCRDSNDDVDAILLLEEMKELVVSKKKKNKLSAGQIAGIVVGCVAAVAIIIIIIVLILKRKKRDITLSDDENNDFSVGL